MCNGQASLLLLDLEADGLKLSDIHYPVAFDLDGDGEKELVSWTASKHNEAFLWLDVNGNGSVDSGAELIGSSVAVKARGGTDTGFAHLRQLDRPAHGGNGDGLLSAADRHWGELRLWIDRNHDGVSEPAELSDFGTWSLLEIDLADDHRRRIDGNLNCYLSSGTFLLGTRAAWGGEPALRSAAIVEVKFRSADR